MKLWDCMRKSGMTEKYVRLVQDMYEDSETLMRCGGGFTSGSFSEPLVSSNDGQADRRGQPEVSVYYDVCTCHRVEWFSQR